MKKIFVITGQTATGKTKLAVNYARKYDGELIIADSRQVYKGLDIITGKDKDEFGKIPAHLYDVVNPDQYFSSYDFKIRSEKIIKDILKRNKTPVIVGGTYLYISHLLYGIETERIKPDFKLRKKLANKTVNELQRILGQIELAKLNQSDRNNPRRLIRRIEIVRSEDTKFLRLAADTSKPNGVTEFKNFRIELFALRFKEREQLIAAIRKRVEKRLSQGAVKELKRLLKKGYKLTDPGLKATGCKQIVEFIKGEISQEELIETWTKAEVNYAKRQSTFMIKDKNIHWRIL